MPLVLADWILIGVIAVVIILGLVAGFSGGLKFFTCGIFGIVISVVVTYFLLGVVNSWQFVIDLLARLNDAMGIEETAAAVVEQIILAVILFIIVQILRAIIVRCLVGLFEINNGFMKFLNKLLGIIFMAAVVAALGLIVLQVIYWVGGETAETVREAFEGSLLRLDWVYDNNPLRTMVDYFTAA